MNLLTALNRWIAPPKKALTQEVAPPTQPPGINPAGAPSGAAKLRVA